MSATLSVAGSRTSEWTTTAKELQAPSCLRGEGTEDVLMKNLKLREGKKKEGDEGVSVKKERTHLGQKKKKLDKMVSLSGICAGSISIRGGLVS